MKRVGMKGLEFHIYRSRYCRKEGGTGSVFYPIGNFISYWIKKDVDAHDAYRIRAYTFYM